MNSIKSQLFIVALATLMAFAISACANEAAEMNPGGSGSTALSSTSVAATPTPTPSPSPSPEPTPSPDDDSTKAREAAATASPSPSPSPSSSPRPTLSPSPSPEPTPGTAAPLTDIISDLSVHFLDVGQADAILIELPNGQTMLIDGGNTDNADAILKHIQQRNITGIDYLVATHPHSDHIGGLPAIIDATDIGKIYMPAVSHTTRAFERLLSAIQNKGMQINAAKAGVNILSIPGLQMDIVAPVRDNYANLNDHSAVVKITYGDTSFLFMGDAEALSESHITADVSADVLKVGHHGSDTSSTQTFLNKVSPSVAIISVGKNNSYGHPSDEILSRLDKAGVRVYRTDLQETIVFKSNGNGITVNAEAAPYQPSAPTPAPTPKPTPAPTPEPTPTPDPTPAPDTSAANDDIITYITNTGARYHLESCRHLAQSKIETTLTAAKAQGLTACGTCKPPY